MADTNQKERNRYELNDSDDDEDECVELRIKTMVDKTASLDISKNYRREMTAEELINNFDMDGYGSTPPRQRARNKSRDWDRKQKLQEAANKPTPNMNRISRKVNRRNTLSCALLNEMFIDDDSKKSDKRSMQYSASSLP